MRSASNAAGAAAGTAASTGAGLGASASGIGATLTPFLAGELNNPQGYTQDQNSAMLSSALGGAGGATAGIVGQANQEAATSRNAGGFQAVLADAARSRSKAAAGASEGIAADSARLAQQKQQDAAKQLQQQYSTDTSGMLDSNGQVSNDINAQVNASKSGWLQNATGIVNSLANAGSAAAGLGLRIPGCWVAAEVYNGWLDPRTVLVREWIFTEFVKSRRGRIVANLYLKYGERTADAIRKHSILRAPFKALCDCALRKAVQ
jgi:hypothetical protein